MLDPNPMACPDRLETAVLRFLAAAGKGDAFTAHDIANGAGLGGTRSLMVMTRFHTVEPMAVKGWIEVAGMQRNAVTYQITAAGWAALVRGRKREASGRPQRP